MTDTLNRAYPTPAELVTEFHSTYGQPIRVTPQLDVPERKLRVALITEEFEEYTEAEGTDDIVEIFDALGDEVYVAQGAAITHGIDLTDAIKAARSSDNLPEYLQDHYAEYENGEVTNELVFTETNLFGGEAAHLNEGLVWDLTSFAAQRSGNHAALGGAVQRYVDAELADDIDALTVALGEIIVTCYAISASYGINLDIILEEIQRSNMSKLGADGKPIYYTDGPKKGKVMKGPNFSEPDIAKVLSAHSERGTKNSKDTPNSI